MENEIERQWDEICEEKGCDLIGSHMCIIGLKRYHEENKEEEEKFLSELLANKED